MAVVVAGNFNGRSWKGERRRSWRWRPAWWLLEEVKDGDGGLKKKKRDKRMERKWCTKESLDLGFTGGCRREESFRELGFAGG